jgi:hypothetical protein
VNTRPLIVPGVTHNVQSGLTPPSGVT